MPNKPKKIQRSWKPERKAFDRARSNQKFYNSSRWRRVARLHKEAHPLCVKCQAEGKVSAAEVTDHITRIEDGGDPFNWENLQSLCHFHHNQKSGREAHGYRESKTSEENPGDSGGGMG